MANIEVVDTGKKTSVAKHDTGEIVERKVYVRTQTSEATTLINTETLKAQKKQLEKELAEVNATLAQMED